MNKLTDRQQQILSSISRNVQRNGYPPTMQELADEMGIRSKNAIFKHLTALELKGYIKKKGNGAARGISILQNGARVEPVADENFPHVFHVVVKTQVDKDALEAFIVLEHAKRRGIYIDFAQSQHSWLGKQEEMRTYYNENQNIEKRA